MRPCAALVAGKEFSFFHYYVTLLLSLYNYKSGGKGSYYLRTTQIFSHFFNIILSFCDIFAFATLQNFHVEYHVFYNNVAEIFAEYMFCITFASSRVTSPSANVKPYKQYNYVYIHFKRNILHIFHYKFHHLWFTNKPVPCLSDVLAHTHVLMPH